MQKNEQNQCITIFFIHLHDTNLNTKGHEKFFIQNPNPGRYSVRCESNSPGTPYYLRICPLELAEGMDDKEITERDYRSYNT